MMQELTGFQRDILYVIAGLDEPYGLGIKQRLEEYYERDVNNGRLYPNLDTLVEMGLVDKGTLDRRTNSYTLSDSGYRTLQRRHEWEAEQVSVRAKHSA